MKERPILFSGPMVRAISAETKSQTRRVVKRQPPSNVGVAGASFDAADGKWAWHDEDGNAGIVTAIEPRFTCPYGVVGDRLWVRERFAYTVDCRGSVVIIYSDDASARYVLAEDEGEGDLCGVGKWCDRKRCEPVGRWRPSLFMPRWASRFTLEVTSLRVERLWDISPDDALAEGFDRATCAAAFDDAAGRVQAEDAYYGEKKDRTENDGWLCLRHAKKFAGKGGYVGAGSCPETDGPAYCDECHVPLLVSLTRYGVDRELFIESNHPSDREHHAASGMDARILHTLADGIGDLRDEHLGRLAEIGFATKWDLLNAARGFAWRNNPWAWVVGFKRVEA